MSAVEGMWEVVAKLEARVARLEAENERLHTGIAALRKALGPGFVHRRSSEVLPSRQKGSSIREPEARRPRAPRCWMCVRKRSWLMARRPMRTKPFSSVSPRC